MKAEEFTNSDGMTCCVGGFCPKVYKTDRDTFIVRGHIVDTQDVGQFSLGPQEGVVEIPAALVIALADQVNSSR